MVQSDAADACARLIRDMGVRLAVLEVGRNESMRHPAGGGPVALFSALISFAPLDYRIFSDARYVYTRQLEELGFLSVPCERVARAVPYCHSVPLATLSHPYSGHECASYSQQAPRK